MDQNDTGDQFGMRRLYQFDPLEHYYLSQASQQDDIIEPHIMGARFSQNITLSQTSYDFKRNHEDRDINIVHGTASTSHQRDVKDTQAIISHLPKRKKALKRKYHGNEEIENEESDEQRLGREKFYKERRMRRSRFRHDKKYDLCTEEDIGGSVRNYAQMMLRHASHRSQTSGASMEKDDALPLVPFQNQHDSSAAHPLESLIRRAETYLSTVNAQPDSNRVEFNNPMQFLKMGYSAPKPHDLPFKIHESITNDDTPQRVNVECNDAYRRHILGLEHWPEVNGHVIKLPRFKGDTVGFTFPLRDMKPKSAKKRLEEQNVIFAYDLLPESSSSHSSSILVRNVRMKKMRQSTVKASIFPPDFLPKSCFNPIMKRARFPDTLDTFHYFPLSSRYMSEDSLRLNTAQDYPKDLIISMNPTTAKFFRPAIRKSCTMIDRQSDFIHYRYASQLAARMICGSSGSISSSLQTLRHPDGEIIHRLLSFLNRESGKWSRSNWIIRASQEMACNHALLSVIEPIMTHLTKGLSPENSQRLLADLEVMKAHLLTGEGLFRNPFNVLTSECVADVSLKLRRELWGYVRFAVSRLRKLLRASIHVDIPAFVIKSSGTSAQNDQRESEKPDTKLSVDEIIESFLSGHIEQISDERKLSQIEERLTPPYHASFSLLFTQKQSTDGVSPNTELNELFSQVFHQGKLDITVVQLTMASLLSELSSRRLKLDLSTEKNYPLCFKRMHMIHQKILSYLTTSSLLLGNFCKTVRKSIISAPLALTVLLRQSYIGNIGIESYSERKRRRSSDDDEDLSVDSYPNDSWSQKPTLKGQKVSDVCQVAANLVALGQVTKDFPLSLFSDIHLTTGIAEMCTVLSGDAADILSRSWVPDEVLSRTPFDLLRLALAKMDSLGQICRDGIDSMPLVDDNYVNNMIATFERVADFFQQNLSFNPCDITYLSWHLAARAGSLILASGTDLCESTKENVISNPIDRKRCTQLLGRHHSRHENYSFIRASTVRAFKDLLLGRPATLYSKSLHHLMISSFLEWRAVVKLLSLRPTGYHDPYGDIRKLHVAHTLPWAISNPTKENLMRILQLYFSDEVTYDALLSVYASMIEFRPSDVDAWANLAIILGPLSSKNSTKRKEANGSDWWGDGRLWWEQFFQLDPLHNHLGNKFELLKPLSEYICKKINKTRLSATALSVLRKKTNGINVKSATSFLRDISWMLPDVPTDDYDSDDNFSEGSVNDHVKARFDDERDFLPRCHADVVSEESIIRFLLSTEESSLWHLKGRYKILCSKILVCAHLFGRFHSFISTAIEFLLSMCIAMEGESLENSNAIDALSCLIDHGFMVQRHFAHTEIYVERTANNSCSSFQHYSFVTL